MAAKHKTEDGSDPNQSATEAPDTAGNGAADARQAPESTSDLAAELETAKREAAETYDRLLRTQAELQNVLKRHERDRADRVRYAAEPLARDLLAPVDDLDRALAHVEGAGDALTEGVRMVRNALLAALQRHGVERIDALGRPFDPGQHEAVVVLETTEQAPGTVLEVHRAGYRLHDRLLRPALVAVVKAPASARATASDPDPEDH